MCYIVLLVIISVTSISYTSSALAEAFFKQLCERTGLFCKVSHRGHFKHSRVYVIIFLFYINIIVLPCSMYIILFTTTALVLL